MRLFRLHPITYIIFFFIASSWVVFLLIILPPTKDKAVDTNLAFVESNNFDFKKLTSILPINFSSSAEAVKYLYHTSKSPNMKSTVTHSLEKGIQKLKEVPTIHTVTYASHGIDFNCLFKRY